ncbi:hypothetical protein AB0L00_06280 [Actinoallomurus sp. NPDC052308]|uniref:hypothetical protein n=1 Tax=Actinoallomurus sp. NPDC052308 TaxID=3155530 RepID=UPI0034294C13
MSIRMAGKSRLVAVFVIAAANVATLTAAVVALPTTAAHGNKACEISQTIPDYSSAINLREGR